MANSTIVLIKKEMLAKLKDERNRISGTRDTIKSNKFNEKKVRVDELSKELDDTLIKYVQEKQAQFSADVEKMKAKIADKKQLLNSQALAEAEAEADREVSGRIADFDKEIKALEDELADEE